MVNFKFFEQIRKMYVKYAIVCHMRGPKNGKCESPKLRESNPWHSGYSNNWIAGRHMVI